MFTMPDRSMNEPARHRGPGGQSRKLGRQQRELLHSLRLYRTKQNIAAESEQ
ncbi:hypothetical protein [Luteimonas terricola]|uniref:hypothetical protein n=1 Tax=Luteimonas terricola TaxID=645597 RepID=UPI0014048A65|nr:hypothetical protein [Luteimonas terricola]